MQPSWPLHKPLKERLAETSAKLAERSEKTAAAWQEKVSAASQRAAPTIDALKERALKERDALKERAASLPSSSRMMSMMSANVSSEKLESKLGSFKAWGHSAVDRMAKMTAEQHGHASSQSADNDATAAGIYRQRRADVDSDEEEMEAKVPTADLLGGELLDGASASGSNFGPALSGGGMGATSSVDLLCDWLGGSRVSSAPGDLMSDFIAPPPLQPIAAMPPPTAPFGGFHCGRHTERLGWSDLAALPSSVKPSASASISRLPIGEATGICGGKSGGTAS